MRDEVGVLILTGDSTIDTTAKMRRAINSMMTDEETMKDCLMCSWEFYSEMGGKVGYIGSQEEFDVYCLTMLILIVTSGIIQLQYNYSIQWNVTIFECFLNQL